MKAKSTINKIIKGVGKSEFGEKVKKAGKFINNHILEDVPDKNKYDSLLYQVFPKRIKQKYAVCAVLGVSAIGAGKSIYNTQNRLDIGEVTGGGLSHMTSEAVSPLTRELQDGNYDTSNMMFGKNLRGSGAEGDLVFALHNMR